MVKSTMYRVEISDDPDIELVYNHYNKDITLNLIDGYDEVIGATTLDVDEFKDFRKAVTATIRATTE